MCHYYLLLGLELAFQFNPAGFCLQLSNCKGSERGTLDSLAQYYTHTLRLYSAEDTHQGIHKYLQTCLLRALQLMLSVTRSNTNTHRGAHTEALTQRHSHRGTHTEAPTERHQHRGTHTAQGHYNGPENSNKMADDYQPPKSIPYYKAEEYY